MGMADIERGIRFALQEKLNNRKIRNKDIMEWANADFEEAEDEVKVQVKVLGVGRFYASVKKELDKRPATD